MNKLINNNSNNYIKTNNMYKIIKEINKEQEIKKFIRN